MRRKGKTICTDEPLLLYLLLLLLLRILGSMPVTAMGFRESELGLGGQEPWWLRQEETMNSNVAGHPRETVSLSPRLPLLL